MIILSHKGFWGNHKVPNSLQSIKKSLNHDFGVEFDIRDYREELVVSHDLPNNSTNKLEEIFYYYCSIDSDLPLALNIKANGLQTILSKLIRKYKIINYFIFDASVPDMLVYLNEGFNVFTRQSEYETQPCFYKESMGVWLDEFDIHWINYKILDKHLSENKKVCIVSPELHGRNFVNEWEYYHEYDKLNNTNELMICTDFPAKAKEFFND